jgi:signal transduction histidine kinase/DNA-binding response OmpR family regulator
LGAALWGGTALFVFPESKVTQQMILVCMLLGFAAGALSSMASVVKLYRAYICLLLLPLMARFVYEGGAHHLTLLLLTGVHLATLLVMSEVIYNSFLSSIRLRLENESLLYDVFTAKAKLEKVNTDLQGEVEEHKKARRQLEEAQKRAEEASLTKSRFIANMSHELKTPITGIAGISVQLQHTPLNTGQKELLLELDKCNSELTFLIDNLLDFTKLEKDEVTLNEQVYDLQLLLDELTNIFKSKAANKDLDLQIVAVNNELRWLTGDSFRLKQVLFNLLDNAIKFTDNGYVKLSVIKEKTDSNNSQPNNSQEIDTLRFCIEDMGPGIGESKHEVIFSSFHQLDNSLTRDRGGTGIGLALSKKLVELMSGQIWCDSIPGAGAKFYIRIPFQPAQRPDIEPVKMVSGYQGNTDLSLLVVDDNKLNRNLLRAMLKKKGFRPIAAQNGLEVLEILAQKQVDLIFMDIQMPVLDGLSATRIIRCLENGESSQVEDIKSNISPELLRKLQTQLIDKHVVIISITANLIRGTETEYLDSGLDYNLGKPFQPEDILNLINTYFPVGTPPAPSLEGAEIPESALELPSPVNLESCPDKLQNAIARRSQAEQFLRDKYYLDDDSVRIMMLTLSESLTGSFQEADQALTEKDFVHLKTIAHSLKGSLANVGLEELAEKVYEIETSISEDPDLPYTDIMAQLKNCLTELMFTEAADA